MKYIGSSVIALCGLLALVVNAGAQTTVVQIDADKTVGKVSPTLYGLMTEEINYSYDGGLYGELIQNRIFANLPADYAGRRGGRGGAATAPSADQAAATPPIMHWSVLQSAGARGAMAIDAKDPVNTVALKNSLRLDIASVGAGGRVGAANDGFWGIPVKPNTTYRASFYAKGSSGFSGPLAVSIESNDGNTIFAKGEVPRITSEWKQYALTLTTGDVAPSATTRFVISASSPGSVWLSLVSLFPPTYNNRPNGNRVDLMQMLVDMKPKFLRFPGGNYLEGNDLANRFNWKETIHDISLRPTHRSPWSYRSSDGMGLLEFLEWCEDMKAQPTLAVFDGYALGGRFAATGDDLKPFVQEALEEIEYVSGDQSTKWGAERAKDGHPEPFALTYVEIGNEDPANGYDARFTAFFDAIKAKYPKLQIIATRAVQSRVPDVVDEHNYMTAAVAMQQAHRFDRRARTGTPKVFMGEWATRVGAPTTNLQAGLSDAAFMTGLERNSDIVVMSCYAPLFVNVNPGGMQWPSDLIGYDAQSSYGCPSYYVQKMFSDYLGDTLPQLTMSGVPTKPYTPPARGGRGGRGRGAAATAPAAAPAVPVVSQPVQLEQMYSSVTRDSAKGTIYLKVVNCSETPQATEVKINGVASVGGEAKCVVLSSASNADTNSITDAKKIVPVESTIGGVSADFSHTFPGYSVTVLQIEAH